MSAGTAKPKAPGACTLRQLSLKRESKGASCRQGLEKCKGGREGVGYTLRARCLTHEQSLF